MRSTDQSFVLYFALFPAFLHLVRPSIPLLPFLDWAFSSLVLGTCFDFPRSSLALKIWIMEGLGAAASVVAIGTIGLQSTKFIYETLCKIKGGPKAVMKLAAATKNLSKLLEQIKERAQQARETVGGLETKLFEDISPLLSKCVEELKITEEKLASFTAVSNHPLWKNVKIYFHEKELEEIWRSLDHHMKSIALQLNNAGM